MTQTLIRKIKGMDTRHVVQFVKYGIAGVIATLVQIFLFYLLAWKVFPSLHRDDPVVMMLGLSVTHVSLSARSVNSMLCNGTAFIFSNMVAYLLNVAFVFESGRHHKLLEIGLFYLVSGSGVLIATIIMGSMIRYMAVQTTVAFLINILICLMLNYGMRKFFIFKR